MTSVTQCISLLKASPKHSRFQRHRSSVNTKFPLPRRTNRCGSIDILKGKQFISQRLACGRQAVVNVLNVAEAPAPRGTNQDGVQGFQLESSPPSDEELRSWESRMEWVGERCLHFKVWVPHATAVSVEIQGPEESLHRLELHRSGDHWGSRIQGDVGPGTRYRVIVQSTHQDAYDMNGSELVRRDPAARQTEFDSEWCVVDGGPQVFPWKVNHLNPQVSLVDWNKLNMYELHVGSFSPEGTFQGAMKYLQHIRDLGFNCVQVMPITEFGGTWGYNPRQLMSIHGPWGTPDDVRRLVDGCHELGMAVLIDVVLNHGAAKGNTLWTWDGYGPDNNGGIYFDKGKNTPWGRQFAFDTPEVEEYLVSAARMWLKEYNVDGLRLDSVHNMPWELLQRMNKTLSSEFPAKIIIAEITPETEKAITSAGFDSCWRHAPHFDLMKLVDRKTDEWVNIVKSQVDVPKGYLAGHNGVVSILGSHDQIGCRKNGGKDSEGHLHRHFVARVGGRGDWTARAQSRMWWAVNATGRCLPMMFMGDEFLQEGWWHCDANDKDKWMQWPLDIPLDGNIFEDTFDGFQEGVGMARCVRAVNMLREQSSALTSENVAFPHRDFTNQVLGYLRWEPSAEKQEAVIVIANTSEFQCDEPTYRVKLGDLPFDAHTAELVFNSQSPQFGGWEGSAINKVEVHDQRINIKLPKWSVLVYKFCN